MSEKRYTLTAWTEEDLDNVPVSSKSYGYSKIWRGNKRTFVTEDGRVGWAVDVVETYGFNKE